MFGPAAANQDSELRARVARQDRINGMRAEQARLPVSRTPKPPKKPREIRRISKNP